MSIQIWNVPSDGGCHGRHSDTKVVTAISRHCTHKSAARPVVGKEIAGRKFINSDPFSVGAFLFS